MLNRLRALITRQDMSSSTIEDEVTELPPIDEPVTPFPPDVDMDAVTEAAIGAAHGDREAAAATHARHPELGTVEEYRKRKRS